MIKKGQSYISENTLSLFKKHFPSLHRERLYVYIESSVPGRVRWLDVMTVNCNGSWVLLWSKSLSPVELSVVVKVVHARKKNTFLIYQMIETVTILRYNNAICNDGSTAVYYVDEEAHRDGQSVMVGIASILQTIFWWLCSNIWFGGWADGLNWLRCTWRAEVPATLTRPALIDVKARKILWNKYERGKNHWEKK